MELLQQKRLFLESSDAAVGDAVMKRFLNRLHDKRKAQIETLTSDMTVIEQDLKTLSSMPAKPVVCSSRLVPETRLSSGADKQDLTLPSPMEPPLHHGSPPLVNCSASAAATINAARESRISEFFEDLEEHYLSSRVRSQQFDPEAEPVGDCLEDFRELGRRLTQFSTVDVVSTLNYTLNSQRDANIVSSIEFDKDCELFAVAGVTKKIKLYDYQSVILNDTDIHYPVGEMMCNAKISCVSWNQYFRPILASSDYDGTVQLWDATTQQNTAKYFEHEKRCWSVNFNQLDSRLFASGSDDATVKLWRTDEKDSVSTIGAKVNVCCVCFNPCQENMLAIGCADHNIHYYDIRNVRKPLQTLNKHKKAVSYVKMSAVDELVSASTDSTLRLWDLNNGSCDQIMKGHVNERNFVGLATNSTFVACGSENNSLYIYYKQFSKPIIEYKFTTEKQAYRMRVNGSSSGRSSDSHDFVSAVSWKKESNVLIAANSCGVIKVLELI